MVLLALFTEGSMLGKRRGETWLPCFVNTAHDWAREYELILVRFLVCTPLRKLSR